MSAAMAKFNVFVPALQKNSSGVTWANGPAAGSSIPISDFYIAKPTDSAAVINLALAVGKNLILTPGVYKLDRPLYILWPTSRVDDDLNLVVSLAEETGFCLF